MKHNSWISRLGGGFKSFSYVDRQFFDVQDHRDYIRLENTTQDLGIAYAASIWAYRNIKVKASTIASIPLEVKTYDDEWVDKNGNIVDERVANKANQHILQRWLGVGQNKTINYITRDLNIWGRAFLEYSNRGLNRLNPATMIVYPDVNSPNGISHFEQRVYGNLIAEWGSDDLIYINEYNPFDDIVGLSPLAVALRAANVELNVNEFVQLFFQNDATPAGLLTTDQVITDSDVERTKTWWERLFKGVRNSHRIGITGNGLSFTPLTSPLKDLAIPELREEIRREMCAAFGVPPVIALATDAANFATALEQRKEFYTTTIIPELDYILDELNRQLVPKFDSDLVIIADYNDVQVLQEDKTQISTRTIGEYQAGIITVNEARERLNMPPLDDNFIPMQRYPNVPFPIDNLEDEWMGVVDPVKTAQNPSADTPPTPDASKATPAKYDHIDFSVSDGMVAEAKKGLEWRREFGRGGTEVGIARARDIANRKNLSPETWKAMYSFFARHAVDKQGEGWKPGEDGFPSNGRIAWALWGGDAGKARSEKIRNQMETADQEEKALATRSLIVADLKSWRKKVQNKGTKAVFHSQYIPSSIKHAIQEQLFLHQLVSKYAFIADTEHIHVHHSPLSIFTEWVKQLNDVTDPTPDEFDQFWNGFDEVTQDVLSGFDQVLGGDEIRIAIGMELSKLSENPTADQIKDAVLRAYRTHLEPLIDKVQAPLTQVFLAGAARGNDIISKKNIKQSGVDVSWDLTADTAIDYMSEYTPNLIRGIGETSAQYLTDAITQWLNSGGKLPDLINAIEYDILPSLSLEGWSPNKLQWALSRDRARLIAQTESTRIFNEGNLERWNQVGVKEVRWRTQNDRVVCPLCRSLANTTTTNIVQGWSSQKGFFKPPAHPGCRCFSAPVVAGVSPRSQTFNVEYDLL